MNQKSTCFTVFAPRCAGYLMQRGFVLVESKPDKFNPGKTVFFFNKTPELLQAIEDYKASRK